MSATKNGAQNRNKKEIDIKRYAVLAAFVVLSAVAIGRGWEPSGFAGTLLITGILLFIFYRDIKRYKPQHLKGYNTLLLLGAVLIGTLSLGRLSEYILAGLTKGLGIEPGAYIFGMPLAAGAMLVGLLFDFHIAMVFSLVVSLLAGLWQADAAYPVYVFAGSLTAAFSVIRCSRRTAILRGGLYVMAVNILVTATIYLWRGELLTAGLPPALLFSVFSAAAAVAIVSVLLPAFESLFKVTTDISLLELLDLDHPLMKNLMATAPGTYHHSIIVGNLVDSVAESIGVNHLLARVAAYYHDIGKLKMPEYFIENLPSGESRHEKLSPHLSGMILISHVKEGVELATHYRLPKPIVDIIEQHHGSSLITYFYQKAKGLEAGEPPSEEEYKYPGPKPQSRVAALVMMADAVEAASRVLVEPTPARIKSLVDRIIDHMYLEGQLDECEITFKDINEVKKSFTFILTGILHKRVDYPGFDFEEKKGEGPHKQPPKEDKTKPERDRERLAPGPPLVRA